LSGEYSASSSGKTIETIEFDESYGEKLGLLRRHMGIEQNDEVIRALICEKCDEIKLLEEKQRRQQIQEAKSLEWLEKGEYKCPM
jgi:hypothetical protein